MGMQDRYAAITATRRELAALGIDPFGVPVERVTSPAEGVIRGRPTILAGTNNYLGLTFDPDCIAAAVAAVESAGTGTTGSRMANGNYAGHRALEHELAEFYGKRGCIVFSTGYQANLGMISALAGPGDLVVLDADCHASIYDGCRLGGAEVIRFRHNDAADLGKRLRRLGARAATALVVVEGIYSMLGDRAPLAELVAVKREYGAALMVDEAHSLGVVGAHGCGEAEAEGVLDAVDYVVGTFSKSLGSTGGFCVSDREELDLVRYASRPYVFTASLAPATIASTRVALRKLAAGSELRARLHANAARLRAGLAALGYDLGTPTADAIVAVLLADKLEALRLWDHLLRHGVYVNLMVPPATPSGESLLRCSVSAAHTFAQVDAICAAFAAWRQAAA